MRLEDVPQIPEGQEALRVEVERLTNVNISSGRRDLPLVKMYYFTQSSTTYVGDGMVLLFTEKEGDHYYGQAQFDLDKLVRISPLEIRE